jgi:four helix bundle protein
MMSEKKNSNDKNARFDLEERTAKFAQEIVVFLKTVPITPLTEILVRQSMRSGTSIGANYCEANNAESKKDFHHSISRCKKEARETMYWLRLIAGSAPSHRDNAIHPWNEARQLQLIFGAINKKKNVKNL